MIAVSFTCCRSTARNTVGRQAPSGAACCILECSGEEWFMPFRVALAWILLSAPAFADQFDNVRDFIRARMTEKQVPSYAVAVARDGKILWEEGFGWADRENRIPANEHTMYSLGSTTKPFTATALMTLVEK